MKLLDINGVLELFGMIVNRNNKIKIIKLLRKIEEERNINILTKFTYDSLAKKQNKTGKRETLYTTEELIRKALPQFFPEPHENEIQLLKQQINVLSKRISLLENLKC